ncbi:DMP19 family protein [Arthrobacter sp. MAHUQ-56]
MITSQQPVVLTSSSVEAGSEDAVAGNVSVVDAMHAALLHVEEMSPVAVRSYYVDFYLSQALEGGFAQYVFTAGDRAETDTLVREGMAGMGAAAHLDLFNRTVEAYDSLSDDDAVHYLDGTPDGRGNVPDGVLRMEELDGEFEELLERENITALNAAWLCRQADLLVLDDEEVGAYIQHLAARIPDLEERRAKAVADLLAEAFVD